MNGNQKATGVLSASSQQHQSGQSEQPKKTNRLLRASQSTRGPRKEVVVTPSSYSGNVRRQTAPSDRDLLAVKEIQRRLANLRARAAAPFAGSASNRQHSLPSTGTRASSGGAAAAGKSNGGTSMEDRVRSLMEAAKRWAVARTNSVELAMAWASEDELDTDVDLYPVSPVPEVECKVAGKSSSSSSSSGMGKADAQLSPNIRGAEQKQAGAPTLGVEHWGNILNTVCRIGSETCPVVETPQLPVTPENPLESRTNAAVAAAESVGERSEAQSSAMPMVREPAPAAARRAPTSPLAQCSYTITEAADGRSTTTTVAQQQRTSSTVSDAASRAQNASGSPNRPVMVSRRDLLVGLGTCSSSTESVESDEEDEGARIIKRRRKRAAHVSPSNNFFCIFPALGPESSFICGRETFFPSLVVVVVRES